MYRPNCNVFHIPDLGRNLTEEDRFAFFVIGLPLPDAHHGPRDCTADYYADDDRRDGAAMRAHERMKAERLSPARRAEYDTYWYERGGF